MWQDRSDSLRDPCVAPLLGLLRSKTLRVFHLDYANFDALRLLRMTQKKCKMQTDFFVSAGRENKCKVQNSKCKIKTNFFVSPFWVSGPKMDAGANAGVTRRKVSNFCPQINVGRCAVTILIQLKNLF